MGLYVNVTADTRLAGKANFLPGVAEDFESEQRVQPLPKTFKDAAGRSVFAALTKDDTAAAALSETHTVQVFMGALVNLYTILQGHLAEVFACSDVHGELFVDKLDLGHGDEAF